MRMMREFKRKQGRMGVGSARFELANFCVSSRRHNR